MMSPLPAGGVVEAIKADRRKLSRKLIGNRQSLDRSTMGWFCSQFSHLLAFWVSPGDREDRPVSVKAKEPARTAVWAWNSGVGAGIARRDTVRAWLRAGSLQIRL
jgi:hypothetical protein